MKFPSAGGEQRVTEEADATHKVAEPFLKQHEQKGHRLKVFSCCHSLLGQGLEGKWYEQPLVETWSIAAADEDPREAKVHHSSKASWWETSVKSCSSIGHKDSMWSGKDTLRLSKIKPQHSQIQLGEWPCRQGECSMCLWSLPNVPVSQ